MLKSLIKRIQSSWNFWDIFIGWFVMNFWISLKIFFNALLVVFRISCSHRQKIWNYNNFLTVYLTFLNCVIEKKVMADSDSLQFDCSQVKFLSISEIFFVSVLVGNWKLQRFLTVYLTFHSVVCDKKSNDRLRFLAVWLFWGKILSISDRFFHLSVGGLLQY
jgi:hypothetical protein